MHPDRALLTQSSGATDNGAMAVGSPPQPPAHDELDAVIREARARQSRRRLLVVCVVLVVAAAAVVGGTFALRASHGSGTSISANLSSADRAACAAATPTTKGFAHSGRFVVWNGGRDVGVLTELLYPHYPNHFWPPRLAVAPGRQRGAVTITAFNCADGSPLGLVEGTPRFTFPTTAAVLKKEGSRQVTLRPSRLLESPGDPLAWLVEVLFYKPGRAVVRLSRRSRVLDRVTFNVCPYSATGSCRR